MSAAITELRETVIGIIEDEFTDVNWVGGVRAGKLYRALGEKGPYAGVSPIDANPRDQDMSVQRPRVLVQLWGQFDKAVKLENIVDPTIVEGWAERLQTAIRSDYPITEKNWYMNIRSIEYPDDPLGQKTRVTFTIDADGPNAALVETAT